jgi:ABC-2 type transport system permease protein
MMKPLAVPLTYPDHLRSYATLLGRALRANFAYRSSTVMGLVTVALNYAVTLMVWSSVYAEDSASLTVPKAEMFPYLALAFCLNYALMMNVQTRVGQRIRMGLIATDLLKPVDFQLAQAVQALSDGFFNATLAAAVFACAFFVLGPAIFPASATALLGFTCSVLLAFLLHFGISFLFIQGAFYIYSNYGIMVSHGALHMTFSGVSAPLTLYPHVLRAVGAWLPFQYVIYVPISIYRGQITGADIPRALGMQVLWIFLMFGVGRFVLTRALKQFEIQGG